MREIYQPHTQTIMQKINSAIRRYILLKTQVSLLTGVLVVGVLALLGLRLWFVWGVLSFILNFIPTVGSVSGT